MGNKMVQIDLLDLEPKKKIYVKLSESLILWLVRSAKSKALYSEFSKEFSRMLYGKKCSLQFAINLCEKLGVSMESLRENLKSITSSKNTNIGIRDPKFQFDFATKDGARFIAAIMGDGHINKFCQCGYSNQNKKMIEKVLTSSQKIFGRIDSKIYLREDKTFNLNFPKIVGLALIKTGLKPGFKYNTNPGIPSFIFGLGKKQKTVFLRQFFSDEGNVRKKDRRIQVKQTILINVTKSEAKSASEKFAPNVLQGCQKLLLDFGIDSKLSLGAYRKTPEGNKTDWELSFYRIENLKKFQELIGFEQYYKNRLLKEAIRSYRVPSAARNKKLEFALEECKKIEKRFGYIDKKKLAKQSKRSLKTVTYYLVELKRKGLVEIISKPKRKDGRFKIFTYRIKKTKQ